LPNDVAKKVSTHFIHDPCLRGFSLLFLHLKKINQTQSKMDLYETPVNAVLVN
jgi:hypothetical protein